MFAGLDTTDGSDTIEVTMAESKKNPVPPRDASAPRAHRAVYVQPRLERRSSLQLVTLLSGGACFLDC
jgi:hypothetical protein